MAKKPAPPERVEPTNWKHYELLKRVREAILALPDYFTTPTQISGMLATDLFTLHSALGAMIIPPDAS